MKKKQFLALLLSACTVASGVYAKSLESKAAADFKEASSYGEASEDGTLQGESIYQIMVDRFYDGDPNNNATGLAFRNTKWNEDDFKYMHGGDWQGIIDKIDCFNEDGDHQRTASVPD